MQDSQLTFAYCISSNFDVTDIGMLIINLALWNNSFSVISQHEFWFAISGNGYWDLMSCKILYIFIHKAKTQKQNIISSLQEYINTLLSLNKKMKEKVDK